MNAILFSDIDQLLSESIDNIKAYESSWLDRYLEKSDQKFVLFGAGNLGRRTLVGLRSLGMEPVGFSDNNPVLWNQSFDGITVCSPDTITSNYGSDILIIITIWNASRKCRFAALRNQLQQLGCTTIIPFMPLFWKYPDVFLPHYCVELPHKIYEQKDDVLAAFSLFKDRHSQTQYFNQLKWRILLDFDTLFIAEDPQYFSQIALPPLEREVFVDCGAFDGDTLKYLTNYRDFHREFKQVICFEPDPDNFQKLKTFVESLEPNTSQKILLYEKATGKKRETLYFSALGLASSAITATGDIAVESVPLDELVLDNAPTFLKMDIEGAEIYTLIGASKIIERYAPILAIACYHLQSHLWQIPLLINSLRKDYIFFIDQYGADGLEVVVYAVPIGRLADHKPNGSN